MRCGWLRCRVVWFEVVVWGELEDDLVIRTTQIYSVLHSTTKYYSVLHSTTPYYKEPLQYYSVLQSTIPVLRCSTVLQSTTPVLFRTTKYYSSTILYYTVLLQHYSVRTTRVLILYYKVLLHYYSVLHRSTPVQLCTTKYYSVLQSTSPALLLVLQSTHLQGAEHQRHQMLRLPRQVTLMIDPRHI